MRSSGLAAVVGSLCAAITSCNSPTAPITASARLGRVHGATEVGPALGGADGLQLEAVVQFATAPTSAQVAALHIIGTITGEHSTGQLYILVVPLENLARLDDVTNAVVAVFIDHAVPR